MNGLHIGVPLALAVLMTASIHRRWICDLAECTAANRSRRLPRPIVRSLARKSLSIYEGHTAGDDTTGTGRHRHFSRRTHRARSGIRGVRVGICTGPEPLAQGYEGGVRSPWIRTEAPRRCRGAFFSWWLEDGYRDCPTLPAWNVHRIGKPNEARFLDGESRIWDFRFEGRAWSAWWTSSTVSSLRSPSPFAHRCT